MNHVSVIRTTIYTVVMILCCIIFTACNTGKGSTTFSGRLIDVEGKPIAGHIITLYPVQMSENGSVYYQPIMTIAASPGFLTARTDSNGNFTFTGEIDPGMIRLGLLPPKLLNSIRKPDFNVTEYRPEYELVSVKIGVMTFYEDEHGQGSMTFALQTNRKIENAVVIARPEMWIQGKIQFRDKKPLSEASITFKVQSKKQDNSDASSYGDRFRTTDAKGNFILGLFYHNEPLLYKVSVEYQGLSAESRDILIQGGTQYKNLTLTLNGDSNDIPDDPKPPEQPTFPGMVQFPVKLTPDQWIVNPANGHAYTEIICENLEAAKEQAASERAYLVAINDEVEQNWLSGVFGNKLYWIGLNKTDNEGSWHWDNGDPLTYSNWGPEDRFSDEFFLKREKAAAVMTFVDGEWHAVAQDDLFWDVTKRALLEKDNPRIGTPSEDR